MKIAVFTDNFYPEINGMVTSLLNQFSFFEEQGHEVIVFSPGYKKKYRHGNIKQFTCASVPIPTYNNSRVGFPSQRKINRIIEKEKPDAIHVHTPFLIGRAGIKAGLKYNIPSIGTYHTKLDNFVEYASILKLIGLSKIIPLRHRIKKMISWKITNMFYKDCDILSTPSKTMKKELVKHGLMQEIRVLSNGVDRSLFRPKTVYKRTNRILHVGRISYEKRIDVIIRAMKMVRSDISLTIAGDGPLLKRLKKLTKSLGLEKRIKFIGSVKHNDLMTLHHLHDIFITASDMETQGLAALEAVASGLPLICADKMAVKELICGNEDNDDNCANKKKMPKNSLPRRKRRGIREFFASQRHFQSFQTVIAPRGGVLNPVWNKTIADGKDANRIDANGNKTVDNRTKKRTRINEVAINGFTAKAGDPKDFASKINMIYSDYSEDNFEMLGKNSADVAKEHDMDSVCMELLLLYKGLISKKNR